MQAWTYSINYGPDGEENYANVYDAEERLVGNLRTHHAIAIVAAMNASKATERQHYGNLVMAAFDRLETADKSEARRELAERKTDAHFKAKQTF